ncbi:MAG: CAP domain-containing protein [Planctomycetaceae bacterium]
MNRFNAMLAVVITVATQAISKARDIGKGYRTYAAYGFSILSALATLSGFLPDETGKTLTMLFIGLGGYFHRLATLDPALVDALVNQLKDPNSGNRTEPTGPMFPTFAPLFLFALITFATAATVSAGDVRSITQETASNVIHNDNPQTGATRDELVSPHDRSPRGNADACNSINRPDPARRTVDSVVPGIRTRGGILQPAVQASPNMDRGTNPSDHERDSLGSNFAARSRSSQCRNRVASRNQTRVSNSGTDWNRCGPNGCPTLPANPSQSRSDDRSSDRPVHEKQVALELLAEANAYRATQTKQPLALDPAMSTAAQAHAQWMANNHTFAHSGLKYSETIQYQYGPKPTAKSTVSNWISSTPHRAILLSGSKAGFGQTSSNGYWYSVGVFK